MFVGCFLILHTSSFVFQCFFLQTTQRARFALFQKDIHDVISKATSLPPWFMFTFQKFCACIDDIFIVPNQSWHLLERQWQTIVWSSAHTEIYLHINKQIYFSYFSLTSVALNILKLYQLYVKIFCLSVQCSKYNKFITSWISMFN